MLTRRMRRGRRPNKPTKEEINAAAGRIIIQTINDSMIVSAAALRDEFGFGEERLKRFLERRRIILEACFEEDMLDITNIETELKNEGIQCIEYYKYYLQRVESSHVQTCYNNRHRSQ